MRDHDVRGVIHLAAKKQVGESVERPLFYYRENVAGLMTLLEVMGECGADVLVFSSSAAVYGMPDVEFVTEQTPTVPLSPYGETKLVGEWLTRDAAVASGIRYALLRYFNVAGAAAPELADTGVANLIPMVFQRLSAGHPPLLFGDDYPTPDGSCVRDFIHVADLAEAHVAALEHLSGGGANLLLNVGRGEGSSVREVLGMVGSVTGLPSEPEVRPRRPGDPARVVASNEAIRSILGWEARHDLRDMVTSAWAGRQAGRSEGAASA
jgi:UDP-glucose 4-epimerase